MDFKVGKITSFDGYYGEIVDVDNVYMFLDYDMSDKDLKVGEVVSFVAHTIHGTGRAYSVKRVKKVDTKEDTDTKVLNKVIDNK